MFQKLNWQVVINFFDIETYHKPVVLVKSYAGKRMKFIFIRYAYTIDTISLLHDQSKIEKKFPNYY